MVKNWSFEEKHLKENFAKAGIEYAVSIGRRAPMHIAHVDCIKEIVEAGLKPIILIGSANGADSQYFDPLRNPMTVEQQKIQIKKALPELADKITIISQYDNPLEVDRWHSAFNHSMRGLDANNSAVIHYRTKEEDGTGDKKPLSAYDKDFQDNGYGIWNSKNTHPEYDSINATEIRAWDLNKLTEEQRHIMACPDYIKELATQAREHNPDKALLDEAGVPVTMLDLTLERMNKEAGISTQRIVASMNDADINTDALTQAVRKMLHARPHKRKYEEYRPKCLHIVSGARGALGEAILRSHVVASRESYSVGLTREDLKDKKLKGFEDRYESCTYNVDTGQSAEKLAGRVIELLEKYPYIDEIDFSHAFGFFDYTNVTKHDDLRKQGKKLPKDVYDTNVAYMRRAVKAIMKKVDPYLKAHDRNLHLKIIGYGSKSDRHYVPQWFFYSEAKDLSRLAMHKIVEKSRNDADSHIDVSALMVNVSTIFTNAERQFRDGALQEDVDKWLTTRDVVYHTNMKLDRMKPGTAQEFDLFVRNEKFLEKVGNQDDYYANDQQNLEKKWTNEVTGHAENITAPDRDKQSIEQTELREINPEEITVRMKHYLKRARGEQDQKPHWIR